MEKSFKEITDELAIILEQKNKAYGNSFDKTMQKWGMTALGIRLDDKLSRISNLVKLVEITVDPDHDPVWAEETKSWINPKKTSGKQADSRYNISPNGESLLDNLFDLAGYSILGIRYLLEQDKLTPEDIAKYFNKGSESD